MAKHLLIPLFRELGELILVDKASKTAEWKKVWKSEIIILSVPRDAIPSILYGVKLTPNQLLIDICSLKRGMSKTIRKTGAKHLSLHPLHGPRLPFSKQRWVIVNTKQAWKHELGSRLILFLKRKGIRLIDCKSEKEHDFMMGFSLGLPEILTLVVDELIDKWASINRRRKPSLIKLQEWAVPASNALLSTYIHTINSSPDWLRRDLILNTRRLVHLSRKEFLRITKRQRRSINDFPKARRDSIRQFLEVWYGQIKN